MTFKDFLNYLSTTTMHMKDTPVGLFLTCEPWSKVTASDYFDSCTATTCLFQWV